MRCGIRRDFEGVKSATERENEGKIVVEFSDGNIIALSRFSKEEITRLGFQYTRACNLKIFSLQHMDDTWTHITELHGVGRYAADAYAIFCTGRWKHVIPMDRKLIPYWTSLHNADY
ncbi:hypothetical protein K1719_016120 [Acacia pycnantha]|nr:hypothetical protein K1719_016120 [Acacia pycnantha]